MVAGTNSRTIRGVYDGMLGIEGNLFAGHRMKDDGRPQKSTLRLGSRFRVFTPAYMAQLCMAPQTRRDSA